MVFGWSGSAIFGGILLDRYGFGSTFLITAAMQLLSMAIFALLLPLVPVHEKLEAVEAAIVQKEAASADPLEGSSSGSTLAQPLLAAVAVGGAADGAKLSA